LVYICPAKNDSTTMKKSLIPLILLSFVAISSCSNNDKPEKKEPKTYIIISDIHLGDQRSIDDGYGWNLARKDTMIAFLDYLIKDDTWDELVIAGDMFDEWVAPVDYLTFADEDGKLLTERQFFQAIVEANKEIFDKFREVKNAGHKLVYVIGNHDMQVTAEDFEAVLPGLFDQARTPGVEGMGEYQPEKELFIEHGHRYDIFNAPYKGKDGVDNISGSILPPGFFISKLNIGRSYNLPVTKGLDEFSSESLYDLFWTGASIILGADSVVTMTDGMTRTYAYNEFAYTTSPLFKDIASYEGENYGWNKRCAYNKAFYVPDIFTSMIAGAIYDFCDKMGLHVLSETEMKPHILVWGHSHSPKFISLNDSEKGKVIYINTGCWIDAKKAKGEVCTSTFAVVTRKSDNTYDASLRRFDLETDGTPRITVLDSDELKSDF